MTDTTLPGPLVPAEVDLRDFQYMELDVRVLRDSRFAAQVTGDAFRAGVLLWCAAWHQVPAGSLPDDDIELANLAGYGRFHKEWRKVRAEALTQFVKCDDGRLYHETVCEKAAAAWNAKLLHHFERARDRLRKANKARVADKMEPLPELAFEQWNERRLAAGVPMEKADASAGIPRIDPPAGGGIPPENALKGRGNGEGEGEGEEKKEGRTQEPPPPAPPPPRAPSTDHPEVHGHQPTAAGLICRAMKVKGLQSVNPGDPRLLALIEQGATLAEFEGLAAEAVEKHKGFAWVLTVLPARRAEAAAIALRPQQAATGTGETAWQRSQRDRVRQFSGGLLGNGHGAGDPDTIIDMEQTDGTGPSTD